MNMVRWVNGEPQSKQDFWVNGPNRHWKDVATVMQESPAYLKGLLETIRSAKSGAVYLQSVMMNFKGE